MCCPKCRRKLIKKKEHGEGVKFCEYCGISWFIVLSRKHK
jgi:uncharacterized protein YbaR (Trm112 family)